MQETGLLDHWIKQFQPSIGMCAKLKTETPITALSLLDVAGVFVILAAGYALAFLALTSENIIWGFKLLFILNSNQP